MSIDTCSLISMIESNNLRTNRIIKLGKKLKENHLYKENDMDKGGSIESVVERWPRKVSRDDQSDKSSVFDDPRQGGRLKYSERKETESGISEMSPTNRVISNNMSSVVIFVLQRIESG